MVAAPSGAGPGHCMRGLWAQTCMTWHGWLTAPRRTVAARSTPHFVTNLDAPVSAALCAPLVPLISEPSSWLLDLCCIVAAPQPPRPTARPGPMQEAPFTATPACSRWRSGGPEEWLRLDHHHSVRIIITDAFVNTLRHYELGQFAETLTTLRAGAYTPRASRWRHWRRAASVQIECTDRAQQPPFQRPPQMGH
jgi:hypothetical protein